VRTRPLSLLGRLSPVEATAGRADLDVPSERAQLRFELSGFVEDLDGAELPAVLQLAEDGVPLESLFHTTRLTRAELVDEKDPALRGERVANHPPEFGKPILGNMGQPEGEEHQVVPAIRFPREDVGQDMVDIGGVHPLSIERQHLLRSVDGGHVSGVLREPLRPPAGAACELEDGLKGTDPFERLKQGGDFLFILLARTSSHASSHAQVPPELPHGLVVLTGAGSVVGDLVSDNRVTGSPVSRVLTRSLGHAAFTIRDGLSAARSGASSRSSYRA